MTLFLIFLLFMGMGSGSDMHNETTESNKNIIDIIDSFKSEMKDLLVQYKNEVQQGMEDLKNQGVNVKDQAPRIRRDT